MFYFCTVIMSSNTNTNITIRTLLEKEKLNGMNFLDWSRNLKIVLRQERKAYVLETPLPEEPNANATRAVKDAYTKHKNDLEDVTCLMLATMNSELQKQFEDEEAYQINIRLKEMFQQQARTERFATYKLLAACKMTPGSSVSNHVLLMKGYMDRLEKLEAPVSKEMQADMILNSLPSAYDSFVMNYHMHAMDKTVMELHGMLVTAEENLGTSNILMVHKGKVNKKAKQPKTKSKILKPKVDFKGKAKVNGKKALKPKDGICFHCKQPNHWKRKLQDILGRIIKIQIVWRARYLCY